MISAIVLLLGVLMMLAYLVTQGMAKSWARTKAKMERSLSGAGEEVRAGILEAQDPLDIALSNIEVHEKKMAAGMAEAIRTGKVRKGLEKAKARNAYKASADRAAAHFSERTDDMVKHYGQGYEQRRQIIAQIQDEMRDMPKATYEDRKKRSDYYSKRSHELFSKL